ncbi:MAG: glycosyltransferase N-terminal domain-containing protein [Rikenellaceae bacterium]
MILYNIALLLYSLAIRVAAVRLPKAKLWCEGRSGLFERLRSAISQSDRVIWFHVASLGEFEQGRPLIEKVRAAHPEYKILLTFFSPSGYEACKKYDKVDHIFYLPLDTTRNACRFLDIVHPEIVIFVKYEYWLNTLFELRNRNIRSYIVSAIFRPNSIFFKWWGFMWRNALSCFELLFVQDENSKRLLSNIGYDNVVVAGDTRFDRVMTIAKSAKSIPVIETFKGDRELFVAGSTWLSDEQLLLPLVERHPEVKFVVVPHEITESHISQIEVLFAGRAVRYTKILKEGSVERDLIEPQVLILDTIGMLSSVYQYGDWAYIGGGFGVGIHNTLEAATFGLPIAFGTNYARFKESVDMISLGGSCSVKDAEEFDRWFTALLVDREMRAKVGKISSEYVANRCGATKVIEQTIFV